MSVRKLSVSLDEEAAAAAEAAAKAEGMSLSAWLSRAAQRTASIEDARRAAKELIDEYEAEHGPIPPEIWEEADATLDRLGVGVRHGAA
jgi:hypothetical protein